MEVTYKFQLLLMLGILSQMLLVSILFAFYRYLKGIIKKKDLIDTILYSLALGIILAIFLMFLILY